MQPIAKLCKNEIKHSKMFCGERGRGSLHSVSSQVNTGWCFAISIYSGTRNCSHYIQPKIFLKVFAELFSKSDPFPFYWSFAIS